MSIDRLISGKRKIIAMLDLDPPEDARREFMARGFGVVRCTGDELTSSDKLSGFGAVVFSQNDQQVLQVMHDLKKHTRLLLDYDCRVAVRVLPDRFEPISNQFRQYQYPVASWPLGKGFLAKSPRLAAGDLPPPHVRFYPPTVPWNEIANHIVEHPAGPAPAPKAQFDIRVADKHDRTAKPLVPRRERLIRRAFHDCQALDLVEISGGRSGASVYRAHPTLTGVLGPRSTIPYFVKIGPRTKIFQEFENYMDAVAGYIPFHLGPRLVPERCGLGGTDGIIVGDWVEESESLLACARDGRAAPVIACLFDKTLDGWHRGAEKQDISIFTRLRRILPKSMPPQRSARAAELGATKSLAELNALFVECDSTPTFIGAVHGDLHADNVRARRTEAILIDFLARRTAPILYDFACLEASLLIDGSSELLHFDLEKWLSAVTPLYPANDALNMDPAHWSSPPGYNWLSTCVRQVRLYARRAECNPGQYCVALAVALLFKAGKDQHLPEPSASIRAGAYLLADRILTGAVANIRNPVGTTRAAL